MTVKTKETVGLNGHSLSGRQAGQHGVTLDAPIASVAEPISEAGKYVTEEEYWRAYYEHPCFNYEWNNGILEEVPVSDFEQYTSFDWFDDLLREFLAVRPIAQKVGLEFAVRMVLPEKTAIRKPDLFIVRKDNPLILRNDDRSYRGICDLCIEALSDSDKHEIERDTVTKKAEYAALGVHEYYILDPSGEHRAFYRRTSAGDYVTIDAGPEQIIRSAALPGFQFRIADLTRLPRLVELVDDEVYRDFVLPEYQAERERAEQERQRAERLAERLRALGLDDQ